MTVSCVEEKRKVAIRIVQESHEFLVTAGTSLHLKIFEEVHS